jgi:tetratricopeptide (TPR) repeat protein
MNRKEIKIYKYKKALNLLKIFSSILVVFWLILSCSNSKNKFINKTYHRTTVKFNVLFNGRNSLEKAEEIIVDNYKDDFTEVLPIAPFETGMSAMKASGQLKKVSEKASKAIQKHSMNIGGVEYNPNIDEAYMLLGKSRYYRQKFLPALEAFNYIKLNFRGGKMYYQAQLWSAKTQIELDNFSMAASEIDMMLANPNLPKELKPELYAHYSDAMLQQKKYNSAIKSMVKAIDLEKDMRVKTRYAYILAQMYRLDGRNKKSTQVFEKVIDIGTPYNYVLHARLDKAANFDPEVDELKVYVSALNKMLDEKKNKNDKEKIYYQLGNVYYKDQYYEKAEENLKISVVEAKSRKYEKGLAYEMLGNVNFDQTEYKNAAAYYDSTLTTMSKSYKNYRAVSRKRKQLDNVIRFLDIVEKNDSILKIVAMDDDGRKEFFENYIEKLKAEDARKLVEAEELANLEEENSTSGGNLMGGKKGSFYLYNPITLQKGKLEFEKKWGDRPLQDQWRILSKPVNTLAARVEQEKEDNNDELGIKTEKKKNEAINPQYTVEYYTGQLPTDADAIAVMRTDRDFAYYALGLIYNEQFGKYELSGKTLEKLLTYNPDEDIILPTYYYLYKDYKTLGYKRKMNKYKDIILKDYPDSRYASIINNPDQVNKEGKESVDFLYESIIKNFGDRNFREAIVISDKVIKSYPSDDVIPKVELIRALAVGKLGTPEEYKEALEYVMYNYPNDEVSETAKTYLSDLSRDNKRNFDMGNIERPRIVFYADKDTDFSELRSSLDYKIWQKKLLTSTSSFSNDKDVFVIFNFKSWKQADDFKKDFIPSKLVKSKISDKKVKTFVISQYNFNILQRKKNIDIYLSKEVRTENK